jgi:uncharacterized protein YegJ (DUF2314 family)
MESDPIFATVHVTDRAYRRTIADAQDSLAEFRKLCRRASQLGAVAFVKRAVIQGEHRVFLWFSHAFPVGEDFDAEPFETPLEFIPLRPGHRVRVRANEVLDWMVNDHGELHGGFSLRYLRTRVSPEKFEWFDKRLGVTRYL